MIKNFQRLYGLLGRWKWKYLSAAALLILAIFVRNLEPKILQITVDNVVTYYQSDGSNGQFGDDFFSKLFYWVLPELTAENLTVILLTLGLIYVVISLLRGGLLISSHTLKAASSEKSVKHLRDKLFAHIQKLPLEYFNRISKGELIQRSTGDIDTIRNFILGDVVELVRVTAIFVFAFIMMFAIDPVYAFISVALSPLIIGSSYIFFKRERVVWEKHEEEADKLNAIVQENLNGIRVVQAFANEQFEIDKFDRQNREKLAIGIKHNRLHTFFWPLSDLLVNLQIIISIMAGGYFTIQHQITIGELISFYAYILMIAWPMRQVGRVLSKIGMALVATSRIYDILDAEKEPLDGKGIYRRFIGEIEFRNVSFKYDDNAEEYTLKDLSFLVRPGEKMALIGPTGSGKSTIIKLLAGLYEPDEGEIFIDGQNIRQFARQELRQRLGIVLQTPFLFSTTVKENIAYADPEMNEDDIINSAKTAQLHNVRDSLPDGYETLVGEKGVTLSGGQKQRVALARTLASRPDILVLDDVTSAVDTHTEHAIFSALENRMDGITTIIISHRITSIQQADRVIVLDNGRIVQEGSYYDLERIDGYYRQINEIQTSLESEILDDMALKKE